jgi:hypothetical protein
MEVTKEVLPINLAHSSIAGIKNILTADAQRRRLEGAESDAPSKSVSAAELGRMVFLVSLRPPLSKRRTMGADVI